MPILADLDNCTGCTACYTVCPKNAISMQPDVLGFKFPEIDTSVCVECKLCEKVCPIINKNSKHKRYDQSYFAGQLKDHAKLLESQSGGAFFGIATMVLSKKGIVYGASFDENLKVVHIRIDNDKDIDKLLKSKYVQSDLNNCFSKIRDDLSNGKLVLFSGTPCQVAGLKKSIPIFLQDYLITVDLICHGVPGPYVYEQYLKYLEKKYSQRIKEFIFRDKKRFGWRTPRETVVLYDDTIVSSYKYNFLFQEKNLIIRQSCSRCKFCSLVREGDLTIADCWGWEKLEIKTIKEEKGISLIIANSAKGHELVCDLNKIMTLFDVPIEPLMQQNLTRPTARPIEADKVRDDFAKGGFSLIYKKYGNTPFNLFFYKVKDYRNAILRRFKIHHKL